MVEGARLESVCTSNGTAGSNPVLSAKRNNSRSFGLELFLFARKAGLEPGSAYHFGTKLEIVAREGGFFFGFA